MRIIRGLVLVLAFCGVASAEDVRFEDVKILLPAGVVSMDKSEAPVIVIFRDSSLVVAGTGLNSDYRDIDIVPYVDVKEMVYGISEKRRVMEAFMWHPAFALTKSKKPLFMLSYTVSDTTRNLMLILEEKQSRLFLKAAEQKTGKKVEDFAQAPPDTLKEKETASELSNNINIFCFQKVLGKTFFLKKPIIRIEKLFGGEDATNVLEDKSVNYRAFIDSGWKRTESSSAEQFAEQARSTIASSSNATFRNQTKVRFWDRGAEVYVHDVKLKDNVVWVDVTENGGSKSRIRFYFRDKDFSVSDLQVSLETIFSETQEGLQGSNKTANISVGMTIEEVIKIRGNPVSRIDLGEKTVITYNDVKLIFQNGKLVDAQ